MDMIIRGKKWKDLRNIQSCGGLDGIFLQCRRTGFDLWVRKMPWRREWLPTPVGFLPGESHGQKSLVECGPWDQELDMTE